MATKMNENGVSTCKTGEKYEKFQMTVGRKRRTFYHYDYRDTADNELFSCVKPTLEECRRRCNEWLKKKRIRHKSFGILLFIFRFIIKGKRLLHNLTEGIKNVNVYFLLVCAK